MNYVSRFVSLLQFPDVLRLFIVNIFTIFLVFVFGWTLFEAFVIYLLQAIFIAVFGFVKISSVKQYSLKGSTVDDPAKAKEIYTVIYFFTCGFFSLILIFMSIFFVLQNWMYSGIEKSIGIIGLNYLTVVFSPMAILVAIIAFFFSEYFSYVSFSKSQLVDLPKKRRPNLPDLVVVPIFRFFPVFIVGFGIGAFFFIGDFVPEIIFVLIVLILKTIADIELYVYKNNLEV